MELQPQQHVDPLAKRWTLSRIDDVAAFERLDFLIAAGWGSTPGNEIERRLARGEGPPKYTRPRGCGSTCRPVEAGERFGRWVALESSHREKMLFRCDCGFERTLIRTVVLHGDTTMCATCSRRQNGQRIADAHKRKARERSAAAAA